MPQYLSPLLVYIFVSQGFRGLYKGWNYGNMIAVSHMSVKSCQIAVFLCRSRYQSFIRWLQLLAFKTTRPSRTIVFLFWTSKHPMDFKQNVLWATLLNFSPSVLSLLNSSPSESIFLFFLCHFSVLGEAKNLITIYFDNCMRILLGANLITLYSLEWSRMSKTHFFYVCEYILSDSKGFWRWYITLELLGFWICSIVRYSTDYKTRRFGNSICFHHEARGWGKTPTGHSDWS